MAAVLDDAEQLIGSNGSRGEASAKRGWWIALLVTTVAAMTTMGLLAGTAHTRKKAAVPDSISLGQVYHDTPFGTVSHDLDVSGFSCPDGFDNDRNGKYTFQGKTSDGRAYYARGMYMLYFDRECDGEEHGKDSEYGRWQFSYPDKHEHFHAEQKEMMLQDTKCNASAQLFMSLHPEKNKEPAPFFDFSQRPGALPPSVHAWNVWCGEDYDWIVQTLHVQPQTVVRVQGAWQFIRTAMPNEKVTLKHGKSQKTTDGGEWEVHGSASATIGGEAGILGFEEVSTEASAEVGGRLQQYWSTEVQSSEEEKVQFELPEDKGQALWQWIYTAKRGDTSGTVLTQQYAFTPSGTEQGKPKCYPGGSKDGYSYQKCYKGWEIP